MVYGFGVAQGHTPSILRKSLPDVPFVGFDSFQGLPSEDDRKSKMSRWKKGDFNNTYTPEELENAAGGRPHVRLVSGFCDATLTSTLVAEMALKPAVYVDIDCDLHSSTVTVLRWLLNNRLLVPGSLVGYDDWWTISCNNFPRRGSKGKHVYMPTEVGEGLAHAQMTREFGIKFRCIAGPCAAPGTMTGCHIHNNWGPIYLVEAIGTEKHANTGFLLARNRAIEWMQQNAVCGSLRDL